MIDFNQLTFRTTRNLRVVPYNRLSKQAQRQFHVDETNRLLNGNGYGYAIQTRQKQAIQEIDQDSALLLLSMRLSGRLPTYLLEAADIDLNACISELLLCELLEIKANASYLTGLAGIQALKAGIDDTTTEGANNSMQLVSHTALKTAAEFSFKRHEEIFNFLYHYNLIPANQKKRALLEDDKQFLQLDKIDQFWYQHTSADGWYYFENRQHQLKNSKYKLYISPTPQYLPSTLSVTASILKRYPKVSFKVGKNAEGILRPDKLVAYFESLDTLMAAAEALSCALEETPAQPVPFTALYSPSGLITWGMDPSIKGAAPQSWRQWLIGKLSESLLISPDKDNCWQTALARLELEGINPSTFRPGAAWIKEYS